jgi:hypothetical protein
MRQAKMGQWWEENSQRSLANNSVAYTEKPEMGMFITEWKSLYDSKSGERGIFSRYGAVQKAEENGRRDPNGQHYGTNPCGEIILRPMEFCNLSENGLRRRGIKVKFYKVPPSYIEENIKDFGYLAFLSTPNQRPSRLVSSAELSGVETGIFRY